MAFILESNIGAVTAGMRRNLRKAVENTLFYGQAQMRTSMAEAKHGRTYGNHTASAPGESPAVDTSFLTNSIQVVMESDSEGVIGTNAEYAPHLEYGTVRMSPRPFFAPAFDEMKPIFEAELKKAVS